MARRAGAALNGPFNGVLSRMELTPEQVEHLREDSKGLDVSPVECRILAEGVELEAAAAT